MDLNLATVKFKGNTYDFYETSNTGFGIIYTLPVIVQGLIASTCSKAMFIVENPEAHLHPYSQTMIGKFLGKVALCKNVQIIIETHSEHVINGCIIEMLKNRATDHMSVLFLGNMNDDNSINIESLKIDKNGELDKWPEGYFDQEEQDLMEIIRIRSGG